jgi:hypothetical protein
MFRVFPVHLGRPGLRTNQAGKDVRTQMSEQPRKIKSEAIPQWADGLYYNKGLFSEALVYHDDEALYFELRGKEDGIVRFSFEMLETLTEVMEEEQEEQESQGDSSQ